MDWEAGRPYCRGIAPSGGPCDCEEFCSSKDFDPNAPLRCAECHHGPSKHPRQPVSTKSTTSAPTASFPTHGSSVSASTGRASVLSIFQQTVSGSKSVVPVHSAAGGHSGRQSVDLNSARQETLQGYRPQASVKRTRKEKASTTAGLHASHSDLCLDVYAVF